MEEKKKQNIGFVMAVVVVCIFLIATVAIAIFDVWKEKNKSGSISDYVAKTVEVKEYDGSLYYIIKDDYEGEHNIQYVDLDEYRDSDVDIQEQFGKQKVMSYEEYEDYCKEWDLEQKYTNSEQKYIVFSYVANGFAKIQARLAAAEYTNNTANLYIWDNPSGIAADISAYVIVIPTSEKISTIAVQAVYTEEEFTMIKDYPIVVGKPVIYLYPEKDTEITVKLGYPENITCSYPRYISDGWKVLASSSGDLVDLSTGRNLYSLYYESENIFNFKVEKTGFVVKGEDTIEFLEEKLELLGLSETESQEFIMYWLPRLEANEYNYIRFATNEEINENMPLNISPNPDTIIRVLMTYKGLEEPIEVEEQELDTPERQGFVVVEWGGTEIK